MAILVDSNVLIDVMTNDPDWSAWSSAALVEAAERTKLIINPIVYAEVSMRFSRIEDLERALPGELLVREPIPYEAAFLAAKVHFGYRKRGGARTTPLPDFFIGAHAAVAGHVLLTRDEVRYRTNFPSVDLISPG